MRRDLKVSLDWLVSMANSPERERCADTIHEVAIHNTERAIEAEALVRELVEILENIRAVLTEAVCTCTQGDVCGVCKAFDKIEEVLGDE